MKQTTRLILMGVLSILSLSSTPLKAQFRANLFLSFINSADSSKYNQQASFTIINSRGQFKRYEVYNTGFYFAPIDSGSYKLVYQKDSLHNDTLTLEVNTPGTKQLKLYAYYNNTLLYNIRLSDSLQVGEQLILKYHTSGCFHYGSDMFVLERQADHYTMTRDGKTRIMSAEDMQLFSTFENNLRLVKNGGCTTAEDYTISYKDTIYCIVDDTCMIDAYANFINALFGKKAYQEMIENE